MIREKLPELPERFYLYDKRERMFYRASGVVDDGDGEPVPYCYFTGSVCGARRFATIKQARAMQRKLNAEGNHMRIVDREKRLIE